MKDFITKLLGLEDIILTNIEENKNENEIHLWIELPRKIRSCPVCGEHTDKVHDYRQQKIKDIRTFNRHTILHLRKRRYVCPACKKRFLKTTAFSRGITG